MNLGAIFKTALRNRSKREFDHNVRAHRFVIDHKEIMVVLVRLNHFVARIS